MLENATAGTKIDANGLTLVPTGSLSDTVSIPAGVTIKGAALDPSSHAFLVIGDGEEPVEFENCDFAGGWHDYSIATNGCTEVSFKNCKFVGMIKPNATEDDTAVFTYDNCTFVLGDGVGYVNCMGGTHIFTNCTFDYTGGMTMGSNQFTKWSAVNAYSERFSTTVILEGCTFINCGTQRYGSNSTLTIK